jgi:hypothetical protein
VLSLLSWCSCMHVQFKCVIPGFGREGDENCSLLGVYAASSVGQKLPLLAV